MEKMMQYAWQWRLYGSADHRLTDGRTLRILHPGQLNHASGPDFFNAKVLIDGVEWAGNVELHIKASDWYRHGHQFDRAYDSVALHVVSVNDGYVRRPDGSLIPQLVLPFTEQMSERYSMLASPAAPLRCRAYIAAVPRLFVHDAVDAAAMERLLAKTDHLEEMLSLTGGDWLHTLQITLARALGFGLNGDPMERLARMLPPTLTGRHSNSEFQLEALLLGAAGLLEVAAREDDYFRSLAAEWGFLQHKYGLTPLPAHIWKFSGTRPAASPLRRIVCLSRLIKEGSPLMHRLLEVAGAPAPLREIFKVILRGYWASHLTFGSPSSRDYSKAIGTAQLDILLINAVAPLYYAYGERTGRPALQENARSLLETLPPESNRVMRLWRDAIDYCPENAWESQGLLHLTRTYCEPGNCLRCRIALQALRQPHPRKSTEAV